MSRTDRAAKAMPLQMKLNPAVAAKGLQVAKVRNPFFNLQTNSGFFSLIVFIYLQMKEGFDALQKFSDARRITTLNAALKVRRMSLP
jgi:hypothetical protein